MGCQIDHKKGWRCTGNEGVNRRSREIEPTMKRSVIMRIDSVIDTWHCQSQLHGSPGAYDVLYVVTEAIVGLACFLKEMQSEHDMELSISY